MPDNNSGSQKFWPLSKRHGGGSSAVEPLARDRSEAAARVLAGLLAPDTATDVDIAEALRELRERNRALLDTDSNTILQSLAEQLQILEAIFHRYTLEAMRPMPPDNRAALQKVAFNAQAAYVRAAALLVTAPRRTIELPPSDAQ